MVTSRSAYTKQIEKLDGHVGVVGRGVVEDIRNTAVAIGEKDAAAAREVVEGHSTFKSLSRNVEDSCMSLMLLQQPVASDMRLVTGSFRLISDLTRIDEMAYEIALLTEEVDFSKPAEIRLKLVEMADKAATMVQQAVEAFAHSDVKKAESVFVEDDAVDRLYESVREEVVRLLKAGDEPASVAPEILSVAKYYERMGDHAQSVADWSIFRATGSYRGRAMGEND